MTVAEGCAVVDSDGSGDGVYVIVSVGVGVAVSGSTVLGIKSAGSISEAAASILISSQFPVKACTSAPSGVAADHAPTTGRPKPPNCSK